MWVSVEAAFTVGLRLALALELLTVPVAHQDAHDQRVVVRLTAEDLAELATE
jgi:hypothetical protein